MSKVLNTCYDTLPGLIVSYTAAASSKPSWNRAVQDSNDSDTDGNIGSAKQELAPQQAGAHVGSSTAEGVVGEKIKVGQHCVSIHKQHQSGAS